MDLSLLTTLIALAIADSVNPCEMAVTYSVVMAASATAGRRHGILAGTSIALGLYTGYYLLGLGLSLALSSLKPLLYAALAIALILGTHDIYAAVRGLEETCRFELLINKLVSSRITVPALYAVGFVLALLVSPCTGGPYLVALVYLRNVTFSERLLYLAIYNVVFIAPLLAIAALGSSIALRTRSRIVRFLQGCIVLVLGAYALTQL